MEISPLMTPVVKATNRSYSKTKLAAAQHVLSCSQTLLHHTLTFPCTNFLHLSGGILKTVNKLIVIKPNTKNFDKSRLKTAKSEQKTLTVYKAM